MGGIEGAYAAYPVCAVLCEVCMALVCTVKIFRISQGLIYATFELSFESPTSLQITHPPRPRTMVEVWKYVTLERPQGRASEIA